MFVRSVTSSPLGDDDVDREPDAHTEPLGDPLDALLESDVARPRRAASSLSLRDPRLRWALAVAVLGAVGWSVWRGKAGGDHAGASATVDLPYKAPASTLVAAGVSSGPSGSSGAGATGGHVGPVVVHVAGAVRAPGVYSLTSGARVADAVRAAGGSTGAADLNRVNLAQTVSDGERWYVPSVGELDPPQPLGAASGSTGPVSTPASVSGDSSATSGPIDINSADQAALESLPGVGPALAGAIIRHRDTNGPFASVDGLMDVPGIGEGRLANWDGLITVG